MIILFFSGENLARVAKMTVKHQEEMSKTLMMRLPQGRRQSGLLMRDLQTDIDRGVKRSLIKKTKCLMNLLKRRVGERGQ